MGAEEVEAGLDIVRERVLGTRVLFLRMKENMMCDKQERQVDKLEADELKRLAGPALSSLPGWEALSPREPVASSASSRGPKLSSEAFICREGEGGLSGDR